MTEYRTLLVEQRGAVEWLTLNRPERLNTLTGTMVRELVHYLQSKLTDIDTRVIAIDNIETVIDLESRAQSVCQETGDFEEALRAFLGKRPPRSATTAGRG